MLFSLCTGAGKTEIFAQFPKRMPAHRRMLMMVHTEQLVKQGAERIAKRNPGMSVGIEMADLRATDEQVVVASVQTLGREGTDRLQKFHPEEFYWVVVDECHHATSATYRNILSHFGLLDAQPPHDIALAGFTATSQRADGQALGQIFDEVVFSYSIKDGITDGWLSDVRGISVKTGTDLSGVGSSNGDFVQQQLGRAIDVPERNNLIAAEWIAHAYPRPTIAFAVTTEHARNLALAFQQKGVPAVAVWGDDPERHEKTAMFRRGDVQVLVNCSLYVEGADFPEVSCVILAAPSKSSAKIVQMVGRGTRLQPGIENLVEWREKGLLKPGDKTDLLVMDVVDAFGKHSLVSLPTLFGLPPKLNLGGASVMAALRELEGVQAKHPQLNMAELEDFKNLRSYVEEANLWQIRFAEETKDISKLQWVKSAEGLYTILLPKGERVQLSEDLVGKWSVVGAIQGNRLDDHGFTDLAEALGHAEMQLALNGKELMTLLRREAKWHRDKPSAGQLKMLRQFRVPEHLIAKMTKGQAAQLITQKLGAKKR